MQQIRICLFTVAILAVFVVVTEQLDCKITVKFRSKTEKKFKAEVIVPSLNIKSNDMIFESKGENKKVQINGTECDTKPWMMRTYAWDPATHDWIDGKNITAKFAGNGWIKVHIGDDLMPMPLERLGIICGEGNCGK